ncbi:MAG: hypothetical protein DRJ40_08365 [Thermoprotei archaeon]|nr:MAG: hypothetical protein DRJ40_08365 [Thermoprotei archaeon]
MSSVAEIVEEVRRYEKAEIRAPPDDKLVKACNELGGTITSRGYWDFKRDVYVIEGKEDWVCVVKREGQKHHEVIDEVADVIEKYRPTGRFEFDLASGEMEFKVKEGIIDDFRAWYSDLGNANEFIEEYDPSEDDFWEWLEDVILGVKLSPEERRRILEEASLIVSGRKFEEYLNEEFMRTEEWENYSILSKLGLNMRLGYTAYGGVYPIIEGRDVKIAPDDLRRLKKVFEDFEDVKEGGNGSGLIYDIHQACNRAEQDTWIDAIKEAMKRLGYKIEK